MRRSLLIIGILSTGLVACQSGPAGEPARTTGAESGTQPADSTENANQVRGRTVAYVNGQPLHWSVLEQPLLETAGRTILLESVLDRLLSEEFARSGRRLSEEQIQAEEALLLETQADKPDEAQRVLAELRRLRGLGPERYRRWLRRNAMLRELVRDQVTVTDLALKQAYEYEYGTRYEVRLVLVPDTRTAEKVIQEAGRGAAFADLAIRHSTDPSRAQGGLLDPISPIDPTYPSGIRAVLPELNTGEVSEPIALEEGFAIIRLERKIDAQPVEFDDVKEDLARRVRARAEKILMNRRARTMLAEAKVVVLDPTLHELWKQEEQDLQRP